MKLRTILAAAFLAVTTFASAQLTAIDSHGQLHQMRPVTLAASMPPIYTDGIGTLELGPPIKFGKTQGTINPLSKWAGSFYHDWKTNRWSAVIVTQIGQFTSKGKPINFLGGAITYDGFAGAVITEGAPAVGGAGFGWHRQVFDQMYVFADLAFSISGDTHFGFGGILGVGISFGS